jgi:hypothetical protein
MLDIHTNELKVYNYIENLIIIMKIVCLNQAYKLFYVLGLGSTEHIKRYVLRKDWTMPRTRTSSGEEPRVGGFRGRVP